MYATELGERRSGEWTLDDLGGEVVPMTGRRVVADSEGGNSDPERGQHLDEVLEDDDLVRNVVLHYVTDEVP